MSRVYDVIVVGLGAMGGAACYHLARRGAKVLGLERFDIAHDRGSSHSESRMIRLCYYEHPDYVPLLRRAYELWHELEQESGLKLLHLTGGLYMGEPDSAFLDGALRAARTHGLPHERLDHQQLRVRFPQFNLPRTFIGLHEPNAGFLRPEMVVRTHADLARQRGAELRVNEPVVAWRAENGCINVQTELGAYRAAHLVLCAGAWSSRLVADLGVPLVVRRQVIGWVMPLRPEAFELGALPVWAIDNPDGTQHYGFPIVPGRSGAVKVAHHHHGRPTDPDTINRAPLPGDEEDFRPAIQRFLPEADGPLHSMAVCMYTTTPDSHFIIDCHPRHPRVTVACGFSGHGFKFASVVGEALADLALRGKTEHPIEFLGLSRFQNGS